MTDARDNKTDGGAMKTIFGAVAPKITQFERGLAATIGGRQTKFVFTRLLQLGLQRQQSRRR